MGFINTERPPDKWNPSWFKQFVERVRTAVNYLNEGNFPNGLHGNVIKDKSLSPKALTFFEIPVTIVANTEAFAVEDTALTPVGGLIYCSPSWNSHGATGVLEITGGATSGATATFELQGPNGAIITVTSTYAGVEFKRSLPFYLPTTQDTWVLKVKTSDATKPAWLTTARLIIRL